MKHKAPSTKTILTYLALGELGMGVAYVLFYLAVATSSAQILPPVLLLVMASAVLGGVGLNGVAPESGARVRFAAWTTLLGPLFATWLYTAFRTPFGDAGASSVAVGILMFLVALASIFGAWGFLRAEEKSTLHVATGAAWGLAGALALVTLFAAGGGGLLIVAMVVAVAAQVASVVTLRSVA